MSLSKSAIANEREVLSKDEVNLRLIKREGFKEAKGLSEEEYVAFINGLLKLAVDEYEKKENENEKEAEKARRKAEKEAERSFFCSFQTPSSVCCPGGANRPHFRQLSRG